MNVWIKELLNKLDSHVKEDKRIEIMEACGQKCPFTHLTDARLLDIKKKSLNETDFLERLSQQWHVKIEDGNIYVVFDTCYCPLVNKDISGVSATLCYCTQGNIKRKFKIGLGRDVDVCMEKTREKLLFIRTETPRTLPWSNFEPLIYYD